MLGFLFGWALGSMSNTSNMTNQQRRILSLAIVVTILSIPSALVAGGLILICMKLSAQVPWLFGTMLAGLPIIPVLFLYIAEKRDVTSIHKHDCSRHCRID
jgi:hypothetical protein